MLREDKPLLSTISEQEYQQWRHSPITAAYLKFLKAQEDNFRQAAMDLWENGRLGQDSDVLRGRVLTLAELAELSLETIQTFYQDEESNAGTVR